MAELKTKPTSASVAEFLANVSNEQTRADCQQLAQLMRAATGAPPRMWGPSIVGFGDYHYVYASGHEGDSFELGFSPRKKALTLYVLACELRDDELLETLGQFQRGVGCLYVKRLSDLHLPTLKLILRKSVRQLRKTFGPVPTSAGKSKSTKAAPAKRPTKMPPTKPKRSSRDRN